MVPAYYWSRAKINWRLNHQLIYVRDLHISCFGGEVIDWAASSKNAERRCVNINTASCWLARDISAERANSKVRKSTGKRPVLSYGAAILLGLRIAFQIFQKVGVRGKNQGAFLVQSLVIDLQGLNKGIEFRVPAKSLGI